MNEFYLLIVGSRSMTIYSFIENYLNNLVRERLQGFDIVVVSGGAKGVDTMAERWADNNGYKKVIMPADWENEGKSAGFRRNVRMHQFIAEKDNKLVVAFWDGISTGTAHNFELCRKYDNELLLINLRNIVCEQ